MDLAELLDFVASKLPSPTMIPAVCAWGVAAKCEVPFPWAIGPPTAHKPASTLAPTRCQMGKRITTGNLRVFTRKARLYLVSSDEKRVAVWATRTDRNSLLCKQNQRIIRHRRGNMENPDLKSLADVRTESG